MLHNYVEAQTKAKAQPQSTPPSSEEQFNTDVQTARSGLALDNADDAQRAAIKTARLALRAAWDAMDVGAQALYDSVDHYAAGEKSDTAAWQVWSRLIDLRREVLVLSRAIEAGK